MTHDTLFRLADHELLRELDALCKQDHETTAALLAHMGEADARKLFAPAGYSSMFRWCVHHLHMSEHTAFKRIRVARAARRVPAIFDAVANGRVHLAGLVELVPHMTSFNAEELIAAATHKTRWQVLELVRSRFGARAEVAPVESVHSHEWSEQLAPGLVALSSHEISAPMLVPESSDANVGEAGAHDANCAESHPSLSLVLPDGDMPREGSAAELACPHELGARSRPAPPQGAPMPFLRFQPAACELVEVEGLVSRELYEKLRWAQALLGHAVPSGDLVEILDRAVEALVSKQEKRRFGAGSKTASRSRGGTSRYIPAAIRREVLERDGGRCTFKSDRGQRCGSQFGLEFDHIVPESRGGKSTTENLRLRCRTHNQLEADRVFGAGFMEGKRRAKAGWATDN